MAWRLAYGASKGKNKAPKPKLKTRNSTFSRLHGGSVDSTYGKDKTLRHTESQGILD
jgi:hypothetical protein